MRVHGASTPARVNRAQNSGWSEAAADFILIRGIDTDRTLIRLRRISAFGLQRTNRNTTVEACTHKCAKIQESPVNASWYGSNPRRRCRNGSRHFHTGCLDPHLSRRQNRRADARKARYPSPSPPHHRRDRQMDWPVRLHLPSPLLEVLVHEGTNASHGVGIPVAPN
jgi:hypothetical protein